MAVLLVTYDLNRRGQNYTGVLNYIREHDWARLSESTYAIETNQQPGTVREDMMRRLMDANDHVYVLSLEGGYSGYGPEEVNEWLQNRL